MSDMQSWVSGINLEAKRKWLVMPGARPHIVVAGVVSRSQLEWLQADTKGDFIAVPVSLNNRDPKTFRPASSQLADQAERQLTRFVMAARARIGGQNGQR